MLFRETVYVLSEIGEWVLGGIDESRVEHVAAQKAVVYCVLSLKLENNVAGEVHALVDSDSDFVVLLDLEHIQALILRFHDLLLICHILHLEIWREVDVLALEDD